ncbi:alpha/beta hydrolase [Tomitella gaofuii]|uniref:alpha/beta hydrolase n=1 Tax=Tomitella gaofuii TaxID=2760083 RepID=UPI0015F9C48D|nr:alpha/beta hydrolase [Tomitella gaofuii]
MAEAGAPPMHEIGVEAARRSLESIVRPEGPPMRSITDTGFDGPHGRVPVRLYRPLAAPASHAPALVWFHGGGMIMGSLSSYDRLARDLAEATGALIANVDYRLAPEHTYPVAHDEAYVALFWLHKQAPALGVDVTRIGVGGDSAGGGLAAAIALRARNEHGPAIAQQVLFYPGVERRCERPSMLDFGDSPFLRAADIDWMKNLYLGDDPSADDEYGTPALATSFTGLPPAIIAVGYADPLRDGVEEYGDRLREARVPTVQLRYPGVGHGFAMQAPTVARARAAMAEVGALVAARFSHPV